MARTWPCIFSQSSTDSRTSRSTRGSGLLDGAGVLVVGDPGDLDVHPRLADRVLGRLDRAVGDRHRRLERAGDVALDVELGVDDHVHVAELAVSSIVSESTRNGMSSVTTSTTEWPLADQPCSLTVGVNTRTCAVPCGRVPASLKWDARAP